MNTLRLLTIVLLTLCAGKTTAANFKLISDGKCGAVYVNKDEKTVVHKAIGMFAEDVKDVLSTELPMAKSGEKADIIIGTIGTGGMIDVLATEEYISTTSMKDQWETFKITPIEYKGKTVLVVAGSDARGTAYGVLELSRMLGVSPWKWWADVEPEKRDNLTIAGDFYKEQAPSVQYRGIFINDEDWGIEPWSSKNFEPIGKKGSIGPKTYSRIFELLLRLRANTIWPAMHEQTIPFYCIEGNMETADDYAIVVGTSHCEPLMRNNAGEWKVDKYGRYNFFNNRQTIVDYWSERLKMVSGKENFYTIGMRGVHDGKMEGVGDLKEQTEIMGTVFETQRGLLEKYIFPNAAKIPQVFIPYKEVLTVYNNGLEVPDDVTLMWCDDNYGYITRLSNQQEQARSGGSGVYYHISYWGAPHDYLWISSTQPARIYEQMRKAWDYNARKLWIVNVGDIKPAEYEINMFLDMAWDIDSFDENDILSHRNRWFEQTFGKDVAEELTDISDEYYRLAAIRRPEFMGWSRVYDTKEAWQVNNTEFNPYQFGDEIERRIKDYGSLEKRVEKIKGDIPKQLQGAFYQLVEYPVKGAAEINKKLLYAQKARLYAQQGLKVADELSEMSTAAYNAVNGTDGLTERYNALENGKWNFYMDSKPRMLTVFDPAPLPQRITDNSDKNAVWFEGNNTPSQHGDKNEFQFTKSSTTYFIDLFSNNGNFEWSIDGKPQWLNVQESDSGLRFGRRIIMSVAEGATAGETSIMKLNFNGDTYSIETSYTDIDKTYHVEEKKSVALNAADFSHSQGKITIRNGLGHSNKAIDLPFDAVTYEFYTVSSGEAVVRSYTLPTHPANGGTLRYVVQIDDDAPRVVEFQTSFQSKRWKDNVLRNQSENITEHLIKESGRHTMKVFALDNGIILDQIMLDFIPERDFYAVPTE